MLAGMGSFMCPDSSSVIPQPGGLEWPIRSPLTICPTNLCCTLERGRVELPHLHRSNLRFPVNFTTTYLLLCPKEIKSDTPDFQLW